MSHAARALGVLVACALLCGCGGGGSSTPVPQGASGTTNAIAATSSASPGPVAQATLTIKYAPMAYAKLKPSAAPSAQRRAAGSARRSPTFVDSGTSNYLDIFIDGTDVTNPGSPNVVASSDGTQTFNLPMTSNTSHQIVAVETNGSGLSGLANYTSSILAIGEYDLAAFSPGSAPTIGLTMLMNVASIGAMQDTSGTNAQTYSPYGAYTCYQYTFYLFAADANGGFVPTSALGAPIPTLTSWSNDVPTSQYQNLLTAAASGQNAGYTITFNNYGSSGLTINESVVNPAYAAAYNAGPTKYPGIYNLIQNGVVPVTSVSSTQTITNSIDFQEYCGG